MNFSAIVTKHFDFLITLFGYSQEVISSTEVQYQFKKQSVVFVYDSKRSYEVIIFIGEKTEAVNAIPFHFFCLAYGEAEQIKQLSYFSSQQMPAIDNYLKNVAVFMQKKLHGVLMGKQDEIKKIQAIFSSECQAYEKSRRENIVRENASKAWSEKDYAKFLDIMKQVDFTFTELDSLKISFAKKQINE